LHEVPRIVWPGLRRRCARERRPPGCRAVAIRILPNVHLGTA
jgi:hypothetical protein